MSRRSDIISKIEDALKTIKRSNGYNTDLSEYFYKFKDKISYAEMPTANITYKLAKLDDGIVGYWSFALSADISVAQNRDVDENTIDYLADDILTAFSTINFGNLVSNWKLNEINVSYEYGDTIICIITFSFIFEYITEKFKI